MSLKRSGIFVFISGFLFAIGLGLGGMLDPKVVRGFLTLNNQWNPALAWVMAGAVGTYTIFSTLQKRLAKPLLAENWSSLPNIGWDLSTEAKIGAALFGLGWGLSGYCPGPALVSLTNFQLTSVTFVLSMLVGMYGWGKFHLVYARG